MRNISGDARRATQDIDLDFLKFPLTEQAIRLFVEHLYLESGIILELTGPMIELKHQDYQGKRVFVRIADASGYELDSKIDIGVHKDMDIEQEEFCFDICFQEDGVSLLMNSCEQIITEKLKSFLRFGSRSTRYKDIFDICYLAERVDREKLSRCIKRYIYEDAAMSITSAEGIVTRMTSVLTNERFLQSVKRSNKNWMDLSTEEVFSKTLNFVKSLQ